MKQKFPELKMISSEEAEALLKRVDANTSPEDAAVIREMVKTLSLFSENDLRGESTPEELSAKLSKSKLFQDDDETETP